jgi:hypothetical protein
VTKSLCRAFALSSILLAANLLGATGNVILTGQDVDYHAAQPPGTDPSSPDAMTELAAIVATVRSGSPNPSLPILILAQPGDTSISPPSSYLAQALDNIGIPACVLSIFQPLNCYIVVDPTTQPIPEFAAFLYSAVGVASANSGGSNGDNSSQASIAINAASANFQSFINVGGGVFGLSSKGSLTYYNFLTNAPATYTIVPGQPVIPGYPPEFPNGVNQATTEGLQVGIPKNSNVNGHNLFALNLSPAGWQTLDTYTGQDTYYTFDPVTNQPITVARLQLMVAPPTSFVANMGVNFSGMLLAVRGDPPYSWQISGQPSWLTINPSTGAMSGTPPAGGIFSFTATVTDSGFPAATAQEQITITVLAKLTVVPPTTFAGIAGMPFSASLAASAGTSPYSWQISGQPSWLTVNPSTGVLSGTPPAGGFFSFAATVTDSADPPATVQAVVTITVATQLQVVPPTTFSGVVGVPFSGSLSATGGISPYHWQASGQPSWLTINPATGALSGTPTAAGLFSFTATVRDSRGITQTIQAQISVTVVSQLQIVPPTTFAGIVGVPFSGGFAATSGTPPYHWQAGGRPSWLTINSATGALSGTPVSAGALAFVLTVSDSGIPASTAQAQATINVVSQLQIVPPTTFTGVIGVPFSGTLAATGGTSPYYWQTTGQPSWLTINPTTGTLSGVPTTAGPFTFAVTVSDSGVSGGSAAAGSRRVLDGTGASPPFQTTQANVTVTIAPGTLIVPGTAIYTGTVGTPFSELLSANGGTRPYIWQASGLPPGLSLSLSGTLSGTPTSAGTFNFTANVSDSTPTPQMGATLVTVTISSPYVPTDITLTIQSATVQPTLAVSATNTSSNDYTAVLSITPPNNAEIPGPTFAASSGRMLCFVIPANSSGPVTIPDLGQFSVGSVAGTLSIKMTGLSLGGVCSPSQETSQRGTDVVFALPEPVMATQTLQQSVPVITSVVFTGSAGSGITVTVIGSSNTQELVSGSFTFTAPQGDQLNGATQTVSLSKASSAWFSTSTYGGAFELTLTFPYNGSASAFPTGVSVILVNSVGSSSPVTNSQ